MSGLELVRSRVTVDIDQFSPEIAERYGPFCDMTSNQALLAAAVASDQNAELVRRVVARARIEAAGNIDEAVDLALDLLTVTFAKEVLPHLTGRVHAQISPRHALSRSATIAHGRRLIRLFAKEGISPSRVCLKIPATGAGLAAASDLELTGVRTLATTLFSVDQARAAAQAGCLYIAPYFNQLSVHFEPDTWVAYDDPATQHPMAGVIREIVAVYKRMEVAAGGKGRARPLILAASVVTGAEVVALSTLGLDHITVPGKLIEGLAQGRSDGVFRGAGMGVAPSTGGVEQGEIDGTASHPDIDWLADDGAALDESIRADASVSRRLEYAVKAFAECEHRVGLVIRQMLQSG